VQPNKKYTYYIIAERSDGLKATSYRTVRRTDMLASPEFINAVSTEYNDDGFAEVRFKIDPAAETHLYEFVGTSNYDYAFVHLSNYDVFGNDTTLVDMQIRETTFYYLLRAWHICINDYTKISNMATALWLTVKQTEQVNTLHWLPFMKWTDDRSSKYELYRQIGDNLPEIIGIAYDNFAEDDLTDISIDGEICYWVKAVPSSAYSPDEYAVSNKFCIKPEPIVYIPQAIILTGLGENAIFKPKFTPINPEEYLLIVYDRTGAKVFETKNPDEGWDGKLMKNGKTANEAVYAYYMRYKTSVGRIVEKKGTFVLINK
jgi:hypothetical protein